jgi:mono/diheme cytochrome c family protein
MIRTHFLVVALAACGGKSAPPPAAPAPVEKPAEKPAEPTGDLAAAETAAWEAAKPVFEKYCASCHTKDGKKAAKKKLDHFDMTSYPFTGHHAETIGFTIREVLGVTGKKPTMPFDNKGAVQGDELALIVRWADAWQAAHPNAKPHS